MESDVHVIGISTQAGAHRVLLPELMSALKELGMIHVKVVCGGIIPRQDHEELRNAGIVEIFEPGTRMSDAARRVLGALDDVIA
jgi:methylmalonyl-CoA mutase